MSNLNGVNGNLTNAYAEQAQMSKASQTEKTTAKNQTAQKTTAKTGFAGIQQTSYGSTIGDAKLSEAGAKYYDQLKKKYGNMDFVLVSTDMKETAKSQASSYGNKNRMVVLIDEEKIERMATDDKFRKQYEGLIAQAANKMPTLQKMMQTNNKVKTIGMQVGDDGRASFFAVMNKSAQGVQEKIAATRAAKKEAAKVAAKKAAKAEQKEKLEEARAESKDKAKADKAHRAEKAEEVQENEDDYEILMADSVEELEQMINDWTQQYMTDTMQTPQEALIGQSVDFKA